MDTKDLDKTLTEAKDALVEEKNVVNNVDSEQANNKEVSVADAFLKRVAALKNKQVDNESVNEVETVTIEKVKPTEKKITVIEQENIKQEIPDLEEVDHKGIELLHPDVEKQAISEEEQIIEEVDYNTLNKEELVAAFDELLNNNKATDIKTNVDEIRINFYKLHNAETDAKRKAFLEAGGEESAFDASDPIEEKFKDLYKKYKDEKASIAEAIEKKKQENLKKKYEIIEELKGLINTQESIDKTFQEFRNLQMKWREIGLVPQTEVKSLWETYHYHVENFYNVIKINKELRDLDLKKNLEIKIDICEKAEELLLEESTIKAFNSLQKLHAQWREVGPVPVEKKDEIWDRFKETTSKINKSYQEHLQKIREEQENNLKTKALLCEKAEEIVAMEITSHKDWEKQSNQLIEIQKIWRLIGFAPKKENTKIYERFRSACDKFFDKKREFYAQSKEEQNNNLQLKTDLCLEAESYKDSTDWKKTTDMYVKIQQQWKEIGPVPRKHSDALWKRFRAACNYFFDKKKEHFSSLDKEQDINLLSKQQLIQEVEEFQLGNDHDENLTKLKDFQKRWTEIGHVPIKQKDDILKKFRELINSKFDALRQDDSQRKEFKFKSRIENLKQSPKANVKIRYEREKIASKLREVENDIVLWENNIGFFTKSKSSESVIIDIQNKINNSKKLADQLKEKLYMLDNMEEEPEQAQQE